ncbi:MAG TPA: PhzF family phenazine biosynthesis protein [Candidatus Baltobacteraceae bacterium]|jgi:trans-2,3-dihydro-3-hydroxyanthranilate isomerase|nr:PhzF family phenazine biosynthesis protein [Candidatus Baltobacteraceae bacterium]
MTTTAAYILLDVFTERAFEGNALAIFPDCIFDDVTMQRIARELNLSETVFLQRGDGAVAAALRIFTPGSEMPFAGHPTIGTAIAMAGELGWVAPTVTNFTVRENVGDIAISLERGAQTTAWLRTPPTFFRRTIGHDAAAAMLSLESGDLRDDIPPQIAGAGSVFLYIGVKSKDGVDRAALDESAVRAHVDYSEITGVFVFSQHDGGAYTRMFGPMVGIAEDPATGSAVGPLYAYLAEHLALPQRQEFVNEQGVAMGRRSVIYARCSWDGDRLSSVDVGGTALVVGKGELRV